MKFIKLIAFALLTGSVLFITAPAHAFAIYNESDHEVCVSKWYSVVNCYAKVPAHSKFNGEKGAGLDDVWLNWSKNNQCYTSQKLSIPKAGSAKIHNSVTKIYDRDGKQTGEVSINQVSCEELKSPKPK
ncbi:MAG: hypothetical protein KKH66_11315 [Proteobacteria bacterium]|nr:hypothetical protein [Pseudomonadota bacterium]MBU4384377.1 hypothetical protein [Pseudomonadota bacterium]MBU4605485.1 hypothetical protein [Pseudomonadota bacterium]MCG2763782.1 hypothetical protein [Desulfarculaceae bacterium]